MGIKITKDKGQDLTVHVVTGPVSEAEMYDALTKLYKQEPTMHLLWDMSKAEVGHVTTDTLRRFVRKAAQMGERRQGGRTAIIAPQDLQYGLARMSEFFAEMESAPYNLRVFRSKEEALQWLKSDDISLPGA